MGRMGAEPIGTDDHVLSMGSSAIRDVEASSHLPSWPFCRRSPFLELFPLLGEINSSTIFF